LFIFFIFSIFKGLHKIDLFPNDLAPHSSLPQHHAITLFFFSRSAATSVKLKIEGIEKIVNKKNIKI
jgi:hypothetical protein